MGRNIVDWLKVTPLNGYADGRLTITASTLDELHKRAATLKAYNTDFELTATTLFRQIKLTGVTLSNLTWAVDVPASGGTANASNCTYVVIAYFDDGSSRNVTSEATASGSLVVPSSAIFERHSAGTLTITVTYGGISDSGSITVYQEADTPYLIMTPGEITYNKNGGVVTIEVSSNVDWDLNVYGAVLTGIVLSNVVLVTDIPASGGTASYENCTYVVTAYYEDGTSEDVTSLAYMSGLQDIPSSDITTRHSAGTLYIAASYGDYADDALVTIYQEAAGSIYDNKYFTLDILTGGSIYFIRNTSLPVGSKTVECSINEGNWTTFNSDTTPLSVSAGDKVRLRGQNTSYSAHTICSNDAYYNLEGNIMSLVYGDSFTGQTTLGTSKVFQGTFSGYSGYSGHVVSAENLVLPATGLTDGCYRGMFKNNASMTIAPELPAETLKSTCYREMFSGCTNLNYVKCLATNNSASNCTNNWLNGVASSGTFVKPSSMTSWGSGASGIPNNWTIRDI